MPSSHVLEWIRRRIVPPREVGVVNKAAGAPAMTVPLFHGTNRVRVYEHVAAGDVIWLVGRLAAVNLPPAIDARVVVARKEEVTDETSGAGRERSDWRLRLIADPTGSRFYPWADASDLIAEAFSGEADGLPWRDRPQLLRVPRRLNADLAARLERRAAAIAAWPTVFVSYAWRDATPLAAALTRALAARCVGVWWDRWSMARSAVELRAKMQDLAEQLDAMIGMAQAGVCLLTPGWLASCCAGREWEAMSARRMGTFGEHLSFSHTYGLRDPVTPEDLEKVEALATEVAHAIYAGRKPVCSWPMVPGQPP